MEVKAAFSVHFFATFLLLLMLEVSAADQSCAAGYTGINCSFNIDDCANVNCSGNGNCSDRVDGYFCFCFTGFYGVNCELDADQCVPNPCKNSGTCTKQGSLFKCNCTAAYEGTECETKRPPITFSVMLTLRNRLYVSDYADLTKPKTRGIIAELTDIFTTFFKGKFNQVVNDFIDIKFRGFSSGSLVTNFDLTFEPTSTVSSSNIIQALQEGNATRDLQFEVLEKITVARKKDTDNAATTATTPTDSSKLATWILVLIISGVILFILLLIIIFVVLYRRNVKGSDEVADHSSKKFQNASIKKREV